MTRCAALRHAGLGGARGQCLSLELIERQIDVRTDVGGSVC